MTMTAPERTERQRFDALRYANEIRVHRKVVKRRLRVGDLTVSDVLNDPLCSSMRVFNVLLALPQVGPRTANRLLARLRVAPSRTCGGLTDRQRSELLEELKARGRRAAA